MEKDKKDRLIASPIFWVALLLAFTVRATGLFHGLEERTSFHPDTLKQVQALHNFLNGQLLWYTDSLAYDGYPYGLNHVDAVLVRLTWPVIRGLTNWLDPSLHLPEIPSLSQLFVLCRVFRVLYGLLAFSLFAHLIHRRRLPDFQSRLWLLSAAISPLLSTVTHSASGDVGTDLFVMAALAVMFHGLPTPGWKAYALTGFFLGCGFATKYHALLAGIVPGVLWLLIPSTSRQRCRHLALSAVGFFGGMVLLTPQFWIRPEKTISLIRDNIGYIRHYGVDAAFFDLPVFTRLSQSLFTNSPLVVNTFGPVLLIILCSALFIGLIKGWTSKALRSPGLAWDLSLLLMGFGVLSVSIMAKPAVQPFHFSFLYLPMLLGAAGIWKRNPLPGSSIWLPALLLLQVGLDVSRQRHDMRMWAREDTRDLVRHYQTELLYPVSDPQTKSHMGRLTLEADNLAVFRNRPQDLWLDEADVWSRHPKQKLPSTPYQFSPDWLVLDLPFFPRDDRLIHLKPDLPLDQNVIADASHDRIPLRITCGHLPARVQVRWNRNRFDLHLSPGESRTLQLSGTNGAQFSRDGVKNYRHALRMSSKGGELLLRLGTAPQPITSPTNTVEQKLVRSRFLEGSLRPTYESMVLRSTHLPAAVYRFEIDHPSAVPPPVLEIDPAQLPHPELRIRVPLVILPDGKAGAEVTLQEPALFSRLKLTYDFPPPMNANWSLHPVQSLPSKPSGEAIESVPAFRSRVSFLKSEVTVGNVRLIMPDGSRFAAADTLTLEAATPARFTLRAKSSLAMLPERWRHVAFVHVVDEQNRQVIAKDFPLDSIPDIRSGSDLSWDIGLDRLPPGDYRLLFGLYDPATRRRHSPKLLEAEPGSDQRALLATLHIR